MVQVRIMHNDPKRVRQVAALLVPLIRDSGVLWAGDASEVPNRRGSGLRVFVEVTTDVPADEPIRVQAERADRQPSPGQRALPGPRALPPGT